MNNTELKKLKLINFFSFKDALMETGVFRIVGESSLVHSAFINTGTQIDAFYIYNPSDNYSGSIDFLCNSWLGKNFKKVGINLKCEITNIYHRGAFEPLSYFKNHECYLEDENGNQYIRLIYGRYILTGLKSDGLFLCNSIGLTKIDIDESSKKLFREIRGSFKIKII